MLTISKNVNEKIKNKGVIKMIGFCLGFITGVLMTCCIISGRDI